MTHSFARKTLVLLLLIGLLVSFFGFYPSIQPAFAQGGGDQEPLGKAYRGEVIFQQRCAQCHGEQGDGDSPLAQDLPDTLPDFTAPDYAQGKTPQELFDTITNGRMDRMMPPWKDELSESERWDVVAYLWSLHLSPEQINQSKQRFDESCASCHGSSGAGVEEGVPDLNDPKWLSATDADIEAAFVGEGHPQVANLTEEDLPLLASASRRFSLGFDQTEVLVEGTGDVEIVVKNGTTGEVLANHPVRLLIFQQEQFVDAREGQTDEQGRAQFTGLPTNPTWAYVAETSYQELPYHSEAGKFSPDTNMIELTVSVYDAGATLDAISIDRAHWLIDISSPGFVDVGEVYVFANSADRVYAGASNEGGPTPRVLEIPLPEDAVGINVEGENFGDRFLLEGTTVIDTQPLPPGTMQLFIRYSLPVIDDKVTISHPLPYYTRMLNLLAPDIGIRVEAPDWQEDDPIPTQGGDFLNYTIFDLPAGAIPKAVISGITEDLTTANVQQGPQQVIDRGAAPGISGIPYLPWFMGVLGFILLSVSAFIGWRKHLQALAAAPALREEKKKALVAQIAALDDAYEAGELPRDQYDSQRNLLKLQLITLLREERQEQEEEGGVSVTVLAQTPKIHPEEDDLAEEIEEPEASEDDNTAH